jgi:hypothetical protein
LELVSVKPTIPTCGFIMFSIPDASFRSLSLWITLHTFWGVQRRASFGSIVVGFPPHDLLKSESPPTLVAFAAPLLIPIFISCHDVRMDVSLPLVGITPRST